MKLLDALDDLGGLARTFRATAVMDEEEIERQVPRLRRLVASVVRRDLAPPPQASLEEARAAWRACRGELEELKLREIRMLCSDPETALQPAFVAAFDSVPQAGQKTGWLVRLVQVYVERWRDPLPSPELAAVLLARVASYDGRSGWLRRLRDEASWLFTASAASHLARKALDRRASLGEELAALGLPTVGGLVDAARNGLAFLWARRFELHGARMSEAAARAELGYCLEHVVGPAPSGGEFKALEQAIVCDWSERSEAYRAPLQDFVLRHDRLGDPRLPASEANWGHLSATARERVLSWLARETVIFFFETIIPKRSETKGRREFWLRYYKRITDFRVALSAQDAARVRALSRTQIPQYSLTDHDTTSAFILKLAGVRPLVVVEFSEVGNAAYVYGAAEFGRRIGSMHRPRYQIKGELKLSEHPDRLLHFRGWEVKAAARLAEDGVRP